MVTQEPASVHYRHLVLHPETIVRKVDGGELFVELADPLPVRTLLELRDPAGKPHAVVVTAVVEVEGAQGGVRGCRVRIVDDAQLRARPVGSEHLKDASVPGEGSPSRSDARTPSGSIATASDAEAGADDGPGDYGLRMAVPAPVVDPDGDPDEENEPVEASLEGADENDDDASGDEPSESESDAPPPSESTTKGKRRRRRRK